MKWNPCLDKLPEYKLDKLKLKVCKELVNVKTSMSAIFPKSCREKFISGVG